MWSSFCVGPFSASSTQRLEKGSWGGQSMRARCSSVGSCAIDGCSSCSNMKVSLLFLRENEGDASLTWAWKGLRVQGVQAGRLGEPLVVEVSHGLNGCNDASRTYAGLGVFPTSKPKPLRYTKTCNLKRPPCNPSPS